MNQSSSVDPSSRRPLRVALAALSSLLHLVGLWLVLASGLVAPLWATVLLGAVWLAALFPLVRGIRDRTSWVPLVPVAFGVIWWVTISLGEVVLGWTA